MPKTEYHTQAMTAACTAPALPYRVMVICVNVAVPASWAKDGSM
jgi:hypothetical protein